VDKQSVGRVIASEGGRKYTLEAREQEQKLEEKKVEEGVSGSSAGGHTEFCLNLPYSSGDEDSVGSYFMHCEEDEEERKEDGDDSMTWLSDEPAAVDITSGNRNNEGSYDKGVDLSSIAVRVTAVSGSFSRPRRVISVEETEKEEEEEELVAPAAAATSERTVEGIDFSRYAAMEDSPPGDARGFYENLHTVDDHEKEEEEEEVEVDWQSDDDEEEEEEVMEAEKEVEIGQTATDSFLKADSSASDEERGAADAITTSGGRFHHYSSSSSSQPEPSSSSELHNSNGDNSDQYQRAVHTAASMADWAGRAVRSALKGHVGASQGVLEVATVRTTTASVAASGASVGTVSSSASSSSSSSSARLVEESAVWAHHPPQFSSREQERQWEVNEECNARRALASAQRDTESLSEEMKADVLQLLQAFDLPFIVAPFEAEAQCCVLEQVSAMLTGYLLRNVTD
jgi:hypothetical protein